jgi:hypothetical protein
MSICPPEWRSPLQSSQAEAVTAHSLHHHFADLDQQRETATLGMWAFLITEIMFFGGLFTAYLVYRVAYPTAWNAGSQGMYFCWGVSDGYVNKCTFSGNIKYGISIGHRDTDNIIENCIIDNNKEVGILFRKDDNDDFFAGNRNLIKNCVIKDNGAGKEGVGIDITWKTKDITITNSKFVNSPDGKQKIGIQIGKEAGKVNTSGNTFEKVEVQVKNLKETAAK